jgi:hypothetical protein
MYMCICVFLYIRFKREAVDPTKLNCTALHYTAKQSKLQHCSISTSGEGLGSGAKSVD